MRRYFSFFVAFLCLLTLGACSDSVIKENEPDAPEGASTVDTRGYYYEGNVTLYNADSGEIVYSIREPMMYPILYGYVIPIPVPDYKAEIKVSMGENTLIDTNSVKYYATNGTETVTDMPLEGTIAYNEGFSITRDSKDEFTLTLDPWYEADPVTVMVIPTPRMAFDDSPEATVKEKWQKFESAEDFNLPTEIGIQFQPYTFTDIYRPILQYHMKVY